MHCCYNECQSQQLFSCGAKRLTVAPDHAEGSDNRQQGNNCCMASSETLQTKNERVFSICFISSKKPEQLLSSDALTKKCPVAARNSTKASNHKICRNTNFYALIAVRKVLHAQRRIRARQQNLLQQTGSADVGKRGAEPVCCHS